MIAIVDYGLGNVLAFFNVFKRLNVDVRVAKTPLELQGADKMILPGVGSFDHAVKSLNHSGMRDTLNEQVIGAGTPILGVCVGMQMLANGSEEGDMPGLGWIDGEVRELRSAMRSVSLPVPHMGWNDVHAVSGSKLFEGLESDAIFYFLHSYFFACQVNHNEIALTNYGIDICCAVNDGNVYGVQFHPEKSHKFGARLLKNFADL